MVDAKSILAELASVLRDTKRTESLAPALLKILQSVTGFESVYLTRVDHGRGTQSIMHVINSGVLNIAQGLEVDWQDTLCRRAIEENRLVTDDVSSHWGSSDAAKALGIKSYITQPVFLGDADQQLYGTLCAASTFKQKPTDEAQELLEIFASLIARQLERDLLIEQLQHEQLELMRSAHSDPLTGLLNRRGLMSNVVDLQQRSQRPLHIAYIDLDGFKAINDNYGHDEGDRFLIEIARSLEKHLDSSTVLARVGGDEFVVVTEATSDDINTSQTDLHRLLASMTSGRFLTINNPINYSGPSIGIVTANEQERRLEDWLKLADEAMYQIKKSRRQQPSQKL